MGWGVVKKLHSALDYIFNSALKDEKCARGLADWDEKDGLKHNGGYSPSFEAIATDVDKAKVFMSLLFFTREIMLMKKQTDST